MRIIGGEARSRRIDAPKGRDTRPTLDRVRETVFDIIQFHVPGAEVLDLYAGSGAYGLEALSRGASRAVFNDNDPAAGRVIMGNVQSLGYESRSTVFGFDACSALKKLADSGAKFDLIFLDPPYRIRMDEVLSEISSLSLLKQSGIVIAEYGENKPVPPEDWTVYKTRRIGIASLILFRCV